MRRTRSLLLWIALGTVVGFGMIGCSQKETHQDQAKAFAGGPAPPGAAAALMHQGSQPTAKAPTAKPPGQ
jgi:hypothetical protein